MGSARRTRDTTTSSTATTRRAIVVRRRPRATPPGRGGGRPRRRLGRWLLVCALGLATAGGLALWITLPEVAELARRDPKTTAFIELRKVQAADAGRRGFAIEQRWVPLARISRYLRFAVVASEDARFFEHRGVDWDAMGDAARRDLAERKLSAGGSTITQQLAKNLYLSPSKDPLRKLRELLITRRLEAALDKDRILEIYLNVAEWGDGVFGIEAAARTHFGVSAAALGPAQAARLAVALPDPRRRGPSVRTPRLTRKAERLVEAMRWRNLIDDAGLAAARRELRVSAARASR